MIEIFRLYEIHIILKCFLEMVQRKQREKSYRKIYKYEFDIIKSKFEKLVSIYTESFHQSL